MNTQKRNNICGKISNLLLSVSPVDSSQEQLSLFKCVLLIYVVASLLFSLLKSNRNMSIFIMQNVIPYKSEWNGVIQTDIVKLN